jgi:MoxR-like ATPase
MIVEHVIETRPVLDHEQLAALQRACDSVYLDTKLRGYLLDLVIASRQPAAAGMKDLQPLVQFGASPRATLFLARAAKAMALLRGRGYVIPEDVKEIAPDVLRHRVVPTYEAEAQNLTSDDLVARLLDRVEVP